MGKHENFEQTRKLLELIEEGYYPTKIAKFLGSSVQNISRKLKYLEKKTFIKKIKSYPVFFEISGNGKIWLERYKRGISTLSSLPVRQPTQMTTFTENSINFHDFKIKIPIMKEGHAPETKKVKINNWIKQFARIELPIPLTIEITTKSAILHLTAKNLPRNTDFFAKLTQWYFLSVLSANSYLKQRGYVLDLFSIEVISQHIASKTNETTDKEIPKGSVVEIDLKRKAESIAKTEGKAKAWIDRSDGIAEIETNDLTYEEKLLLMPETIERLDKKVDKNNEINTKYYESIKQYTKQINLHLNVEKNQLENLKKQNELMEKQKILMEQQHNLMVDLFIRMEKTQKKRKK